MITEVAFLTTGIAVGVLAEHIINNVRVEQAYDKGVEDGFNRHKKLVKESKCDPVNSDALDDLVEAFSFSQVCGDCPFKDRCHLPTRNAVDSDAFSDATSVCQRTVYRELNIEV